MRIHRYGKLQCNIFSISVIYYLSITDRSGAWKFFTNSHAAAPFQSYIHAARTLHIYLVSLGCEWEIGLCCNALSQYILTACIFWMSVCKCPPTSLQFLQKKNFCFLMESLTIVLFKNISLGYSCIIFVSLYKTCSLGVLTALFHATLPIKRNNVCLEDHDLYLSN